MYGFQVKAHIAKNRERLAGEIIPFEDLLAFPVDSPDAELFVQGHEPHPGGFDDAVEKADVQCQFLVAAQDMQLFLHRFGGRGDHEQRMGVYEVGAAGDDRDASSSSLSPNMGAAELVNPYALWQ